MLQSQRRGLDWILLVVESRGIAYTRLASTCWIPKFPNLSLSNGGPGPAPSTYPWCPPCNCSRRLLALRCFCVIAPPAPPRAGSHSLRCPRYGVRRTSEVQDCTLPKPSRVSLVLVCLAKLHIIWFPQTCDRPFSPGVLPC